MKFGLWVPKITLDFLGCLDFKPLKSGNPRKLMKSRKISQMQEDKYQVCNKKTTFSWCILCQLLPVGWLNDIGEVGTINRQLEVIFGTQALGFQLRGHGSALEQLNLTSLDFRELSLTSPIV
jgi:hypothetical protein